MTDGTSRAVDCPQCGETFDPSAAGGWCTNPDCGEWQYEPTETGSSEPETATDGSGDATADEGEGEEHGADSHDSGSGDAEPDQHSDPDETTQSEESDRPDEGSGHDGAASPDDANADHGEDARADGADESAHSDGSEDHDGTNSRDDAGAGPTEGTESGEPAPAHDGQGESGDADEAGDDGVDIACPDCGERVAPDDNFCRSCGADVSTLRAGGELAACPACEGDVEPEDNFCRNCGEDLNAHRPGAAGAGTAGGQGTDGQSADAGGQPSATGTGGQRETGPVVLTVRNREIQVTDGDTLGREVRSAIVETGGDETDAVRIHREHVRFEREDGQFYLVDLAENPTVVNGQSLTRGDRVPVSAGDRIELSNVARLRVRDA